MPWFALSRRFTVLTVLCSLTVVCGGNGPETAETPTGIRTEAVATTLPSGAFVVVSGDDLEGFWTRLQTSALYQDLAAIDDVRGVMAPLAESQREIEDELCLRVDEETLMTIFGRRFDLGFYGQLPGDRVDAAIVAEIEDAEAVRATVRECEDRLAADRGATFTDEEYAGADVRVATNREGEEVLFYAIGDQRLTIATTRTRLQQALDLGGGEEGESMISMPAYVDVLENLPEATLVVWMDQRALARAATTVADSAAPEGDPDRERMAAAARAMEEFRVADAVGIGAWWTDAGIRADSYSIFPPEGERSDLVRMFAGAGGPIRTLAYQPESTLLYGAMNSIDARLVYDAIYEYAVDATRIQMGAAGSPDSARADSVVAATLAAFERDAGFDLEDDLVAWIGNEVAFAMTGVDRTGFFPVPEVALTVGVQDADRARAFFSTMETRLADLARQRASVPLQWQGIEHEGQAIRTAPTPMGEGLALSYTVTPEFAIVASNQALVRSMLDARAGRANALPSNAGFASLTTFYSDRATALGFMDIEGILTQVESLMAAYGGMAGGGAAMADSTSTARRVVAALKNAPRLGFYATADDAGATGHFLLEVR